MCVGIPMQVRGIEPGFATCEGRGELRRVSTLLLGTVELGDWLLVFLSDARERLTPERAARVDEALDMVAQAMTGQYGFNEPDQAFDAELPSAMSVEHILHLTRGR